MALLQNMNKHRKDMEETSRQLLKQVTSPDFISRSFLVIQPVEITTRRQTEEVERVILVFHDMHF